MALKASAAKAKAGAAIAAGKARDTAAAKAVNAPASNIQSVAFKASRPRSRRIVAAAITPMSNAESTAKPAAAAYRSARPCWEK